PPATRSVLGDTRGARTNSRCQPRCQRLLLVEVYPRALLWQGGKRTRCCRVCGRGAIGTNGEQRARVTRGSAEEGRNKAAVGLGLTRSRSRCLGCGHA
ncbi:unnamed protein product, partial [Ectocarpus fasciculatus]